MSWVLSPSQQVCCFKWWAHLDKQHILMEQAEMVINHQRYLIVVNFASGEIAQYVVTLCPHCRQPGAGTQLAHFNMEEQDFLSWCSWRPCHLHFRNTNCSRDVVTFIFIWIGCRRGSYYKRSLHLQFTIYIYDYFFHDWLFILYILGVSTFVWRWQLGLCKDFVTKKVESFLL